MTSVIARAMEKFPRKGSKDISSNGNANGRVIPPEPVQQQADSNHFVDDNFDPALTAHNLARANKMVKSLKWDQHLAKDAKAYAQKLAKLGKMQHSGVEGQGENLFMSTGDASLEQAVQSWLNEEKKYNGETIGSGNLQDFGHFTQCLWRSTTHVGMGKATAADGSTFIVARYTPRGNIVDERPF